MTPWDLQKSLIAEIEELLAQMQLKNAAGEDVFGVKGYEQRLPEITDDEEDQSQFFPYFIVRIEEGNTPTDEKEVQNKQYSNFLQVFFSRQEL